MPITIEDYLEYLDKQKEINPTITGVDPPALQQDIPDPGRLSFRDIAARRAGDDVKQEVASENALTEFMGSALWGGISGLTWGASGFVKEEKKWDDMTEWEKAGWVTGEGLSLFAPFVGPFAILGKGGRGATKLFRANRYVTNAAKDLVKTDTLMARGVIEDAARRGAIDEVTRNALNKQLQKNLPKAMRGRQAVSSLRSLNADTKTAAGAIRYLEQQGAGVAKKILDDTGLDFGTGAAKRIGRLYVDGLKDGRYVNDIGEWVTRIGLNGQNPGNIRKYLGMFAQDAVYMGLHAVGSAKIESMVHRDEYNPLVDTNANYSEIPLSVGIMALGFPLIRGIRGGGQETLKRGIQDYFTRYRKINYNKISKQGLKGEIVARELYGTNVRGANLNLINKSKHADKSYKMRDGTVYSGKAELERGAKYTLNKSTGEIESTLPLKHVVELLNKMRVGTSKELTKRFRTNYFGDLWESKARIGTGILFMNYGAFQSGAFDDMSPQELSSHLFMAALMTKGRGAWGHSEAMGYISREYGDMRKALDFLKVDYKNIDRQLAILSESDIQNSRNVLYGHNEATEKIVNTLDAVFEKGEGWSRDTGEKVDLERYPKVRELITVYNGLKKQIDARYDPIDIENVSNRTLETLKKDLDIIEIGGKPINRITLNELKFSLGNETIQEVRGEYWRFGNQLSDQLEIPFQARDDGTGATAKKITAPEGVEIPNVNRYNDLLDQFGGALKIEVLSGIDSRESLVDLAAKKGMTIEQYDAALGESMNNFMTAFGERYQHHNLYLPFESNIFLKGINVIRGNLAKDDIYKVVTNIESDKQNVITLREGMREIFGVNGKFNKSIFENEIEGKRGDELVQDQDSAVFENLNIIKPVYDLMRDLTGIGTTEASKRGIKNSKLTELADKIEEMGASLPYEWKSNLYENAFDVFSARLFSGGNKLTFRTLQKAQEENLVYTKHEGGSNRIVVPRDSAIDNYIVATGMEASVGKSIKESIGRFESMFKPGMVIRGKLVGIDTPLERWVEFVDHHSNSRIEEFLTDLPNILDNLQKPSFVENSLTSIKDKISKIGDIIKDPDRAKDLDPDTLKDLLIETKILHKDLKDKNMLSDSSDVELERLIDTMEGGIGDYTLQKATYSEEAYGEVITGFDAIIQKEVDKVSFFKNTLQEQNIKIHNHLTGRNPDLSFSQAKEIYEQLVTGLKELAGDKLTEKEVPLSKLVEEFNNEGNWRDIETLLKTVSRTAGMFNQHQVTFNETASEILNNMQRDKLPNEKPLNFQELMMEYPSLQSSKDVNKPSDRFIVDMNNAVASADPAKALESVFKEYIGADIETKYSDDPTKAAAEYLKFQKTQAEPIIQKIFSSTEQKKKVIILDHEKLRISEKPISKSLSIMTLDREYTSDPDKKYTYFLLTGTAKIGGRTVNLDETADVGGEWLKMQSYFDRAIPIDMDKLENLYERARETNNIVSAEELKEIAYYDPDSPIQTDKVYMRLSPYLRFLFPKTKENIELLNDDFTQVYQQKLADYNNLPRSLRTLKKIFGDLSQSTSISNDKLRLKMLFVHYNRTMSPEFNKMIQEMSFGGGKEEYNSFKRGYLADGGTSSMLSREALTWSSVYNQDPIVKAYDTDLLNRGSLRIAVVEDEVDVDKENHFFHNAKMLIKKYTNRVSPAGTLQDRLTSNFINEITDGKYKSLDSFFMDGGEIASTGLHASLKSKKGGADQTWNGLKTTIMHNDMLGKGYTVSDPKITPILDQLGVDLLVGKTVAKTLNLDKVIPYRIDPARDLATGWEQDLLNIDMNRNIIEIPFENLGISFTSHEGVGVNYSSSMFDFQNIQHTKKAVKLYQIDKIIEDMANINKHRNLGNGELLRALYKIRQEEMGQQLSTDNYTLTEDLLKYGGRESNILLQKTVLRLLQSEFYKIVTKRPTRFGEEGFSAVDVDNTLRDPVYATFKGTGLAPFTPHPNYDVVYQHGGGSITHALSKKVLGNDVLNDIPIIARDKDTGLDIVYWVDKKGNVSHYSSLLNFQKKAPGSDIKGLNAGEKVDVKDSNIEDVKGTIKHLHETLKGKVRNANVGDAINLLKSSDPAFKLPGSKRWFQKAGKIGLEQKYADIAKEYDIQLGMSINAIPKVLKDQPLLRIEKILDESQNGLATLNTFDIRVTLQRDYDGDHIYKYLKMPKSMQIDYINDMGDITDYKPLENIVMNDKVNMFGIGADGKAGSDIKSIGFDRIANEVVTKKRIVSSLISRKGTLSYILNSGLQLNGKSFINNDFLKKNADIALTEALEVFQRTGELNQGSVDLWKGSPSLAEKLSAIENYYLYGQTGSYGKASEHHTSRSFFSDQKFGGTKFERGIFSIMHRVLSKARLMDNDVYDEGGKRQPTTSEVSRARRDIIDFYDKPNRFIIRRLLSQARRHRKKGENDEYNKIISNIGDYFFPEVLKSRNLDSVIELLGNGEIPVHHMKKRFTFKDGTTEGIKSSVSGHILDEISKNPIFYDRVNKGDSNSERNIITESFNGMYNKIHTLLSFKDWTPDQIEEMMWNESIVDIPRGVSVNMYKANMRGILKFVADSQYTSELRTLRLLSKESFPDQNKIERAQDRIGVLKVVTDVLNRQMVNDFVLDKEKHLNRFFQSKPKEDINWSYKEFPVSGNLYRIAGKITEKNLRKRKTSAGIEYIGYVKQGKRKRIRNGYTYVIDTKPVQYKSVDDAEARWNKSFEKATIMGDLKADFFINPQENPFLFNKFIIDVSDLKNNIRESYSKALDGSKDSPAYRKDFYYHSSVETDAMIDKFFKDHNKLYNKEFFDSIEMHGIDGIVKYLIQPTIQQNVYWKDGSMEAPYFKANVHLVESIFKWLSKKRVDSQDTNAEHYSDGKRTSEDIIRSIVEDMNTFHDYTNDNISFKVKGYNSMKLSGSEEWDKFTRTTKQSLMDDWYHNPVLSHWAKQFYTGRGDFVEMRDSNGKMQRYYNFGGDIDPKMKKIWSNDKCH